MEMSTYILDTYINLYKWETPKTSPTEIISGYAPDVYINTCTIAHYYTYAQKDACIVYIYIHIGLFTGYWFSSGLYQSDVARTILIVEAGW